MKGPGVRIDQDVRRIWRCEKCGRIARTGGAVTSQRCRCFEDGVWMTLQPPVKREPFQPPHREPIDDPDALPDVPINYAAESTAAGSEMVTSPVVSVSVESVTIVSAAAAAASDEPAVTATETVRLETNPVTRDAPPEPDPFGTGVEAPPPGTA